MDSTTWALGAAAAGLLIGVGLAWLGWRGRRVDDHPICRRCGFDLFGRPVDSLRCPECGAATAAPRAVRVGNRRRAYRLLTVGGVLLLAFGGLLTSVGIVTLRGVDIVRYKPVSWLRWDVRHGSAEAAGAAASELMVRDEARPLSGDERRAVADALFARLKAAPLYWDWGVGTRLDRWHEDGTLDEALWQHYGRQVWPMRLVARAAVRRGSRFEIKTIPVRAALPARDERASRTFRFRLESMTVAGAGVPAPRLSGTLWLTPLGSTGGWGGGLVSFDDHTWGRLADGSVTIRCVLQASIGDQAKGVSQPIWGGQLVQELVVNVVPRNEQVVRLVTPVGVRQELLRALRVMPLRPQRQDGIAFELSGGPLPVNISARVILRLGRRERPVGVVLARKGERLSFPLNGFVDGMGSSGVDVILRPDVTLAEETADVTEVWGEDIVFPGAEAER